MSTLRIIRYGLWGLVAIAAVVAALVASGVFDTDDDPAPFNANVEIGTPFTLVTHEGEAITEAAFEEHPTLVFFGFTFCPDVCPTALAEVSAWLAELGSEAADLEVYFVTVDPERDQPEQMAEYLGVFDDRIVGITGEVDDVHRMLDGYHVFYRRYEAENVGYLMDHASSFYLLDRQGDFAGTIAFDDTREVALSRIRSLIDG